MIKSSLTISSTTSFRESTTVSSSTQETSSSVANIKNFNEMINDDGTIQITDDTKTLSSVINNIINVFDPTNNSVQQYLLDNDDINIQENDDSNTITIVVDASFSGKQAIFSMF